MNSKAKIVLCSLLALLCAGVMIALMTLNLGIPFLSTSDWSDAGYDLILDNGIQEFTADINSLKIEWSAGSIRLLAKDTDRITMVEPAQSNEKDRLRYKIENGVLTIHERKGGLNIGFSAMSSKNLEVILPIEVAQNLVNVEIDCASSDIDIQRLNVKNLEVNCASASLNATGSYGTISMDTASGDAHLDCDVQRVLFNSASGDLNLTSHIVPTQIDVDTVSGTSRIRIPADAQFTLEQSSMSGKNTVEGFVGSFSNDKFVCGNGSGAYRFDSVSGNMTIEAIR